MMTILDQYTLGIIVCYHPSQHHPPFAESPFFYQLAHVGKQLPMRVIVFSPKEINWEKRTILAWYVSTEKQWKKSTFPLPRILYDRCYYRDQQHYMEYKNAILQIEKDPHTRFLGRALGGKAQTYEMLEKDDRARPFLPPTLRYRSPADVLEFIKEKDTVLLKPNGGSHGRGIIGIKKKGTMYLLQGRHKSNQPFQHTAKNTQELSSWLQKFIGNTRYIIQPFLELSTADGHPFDIRILVQKNEKKQWETTGLAVRIGNQGTITSNLHGGGKAVPIHSFLKKNYAEESIANIYNQINQVSSLIPSLIEENHGPLVELGLDIGIDRQGVVWLLEANSKPGRSVFIQTGEKEVRRRSIELPMNYAYSLLRGTQEASS